MPSNAWAFTPDRRTGDYILWTDTAASLKRLLIGVAIAALVGIAVGVPNGLLPWFGAFLVAMGAGDVDDPAAGDPCRSCSSCSGSANLAKVMLIVLGTAPFLMRDIEQRVRELPREQLVKAQTLDGTTWQIAVRVVLPQVLPRLVDGVRLSLGSAWLFLIAAEAIASTDGLGYRIFLVRRYLSMDVILPYVVWITLAGFSAGFRAAAGEPTLLPLVRSLT